MSEDNENKVYRPRINISSQLPKPNPYVLLMDGQYKESAFNEERAPLNKGKWRSDIFKKEPQKPMDLEIGTGNGNHFAHHAIQNPDRVFLGMELKYKPLVQSIRLAMSGGAKNAKIIRYHAYNIEDLFEENELDNVYIHFPDPWTTPNKPRHRIVNREFLKKLFLIQKAGSFIEFKTDSREYFLWALEEIAASPYQVEFQTFDLHSTEVAKTNFMTTFEKIFLKQKIEINYIKLIKK